MFVGKTAIITGGSRGIGAACAVKLAEQGADIAILAAHMSEKAGETAGIIEKMGRKVKVYVCDVSDFSQVSKTVETVINDFSHIDILVNSAGITKDKLIIQMTDEEIDSVIDTNLKGCMYVTKACIRSLDRKSVV